MQVTTMGYGDIVPVTHIERIMSICVALVRRFALLIIIIIMVVVIIVIIITSSASCPSALVRRFTRL